MPLGAQSRHVASLPAEPETVGAFLTARMQEGRKASSLSVAAAAIRHYHREAGLSSPTEQEGVQNVMPGIRRTIGIAPTQKQAMTAERLAVTLAHLPNSIAGKRARR